MSTSSLASSSLASPSISSSHVTPREVPSKKLVELLDKLSILARKALGESAQNEMSKQQLYTDYRELVGELLPTDPIRTYSIWEPSDEESKHDLDATMRRISEGKISLRKLLVQLKATVGKLLSQTSSSTSSSSSSSSPTPSSSSSSSPSCSSSSSSTPSTSSTLSLSSADQGKLMILTLNKLLELANSAHSEILALDQGSDSDSSSKIKWQLYRKYKMMMLEMSAQGRDFVGGCCIWETPRDQKGLNLDRTMQEIAAEKIPLESFRTRLEALVNLFNDMTTLKI